MEKTEPQITKDAISRLKRMGACRPVKIVGHDGQEAGVSDIIVCAGGRYVAIEMKRPGLKHKLTALQCMFLDDIEASGGYAAVCTSVEQVASVVEDAMGGKVSRWRDEAEERAFPKRNRKFPAEPETT